MARYLCKKSCFIYGQHYEERKVYDFLEVPDASFFEAFNDDILKPAGQGSLDRNRTFRFDFIGWDDLRFPATGINPPGATSDPTRNTSDGLLDFSASAVNLVMGVAQMPHSWKEGTRVEPHIHWMVPNSNTGVVVWKFEYTVAKRNEVFPAYADITVLAPAPEVASRNGFTSFGHIDMEGKTASSVILWKLSRLGDNATDTYGSVAKLLEFDIHYLVDSLGSGEIREK